MENVVDHSKECKGRIYQDEKRMMRAKVGADREKKAKSWTDQKKGREMIKANKARSIKEQAELQNYQVKDLAKKAREVLRLKIKAEKFEAEKVKIIKI
jgi:hypothetical protein